MFLRYQYYPDNMATLAVSRQGGLTSYKINQQQQQSSGEKKLINKKQLAFFS